MAVPSKSGKQNKMAKLKNLKKNQKVKVQKRLPQRNLANQRLLQLVEMMHNQNQNPKEKANPNPKPKTKKKIKSKKCLQAWVKAKTNLDAERSQKLKIIYLYKIFIIWKIYK